MLELEPAARQSFHPAEEAIGPSDAYPRILAGGQEDRRRAGQTDDNNENNASYQTLTALRIFRLMRLMRLMSMNKGIRTVVATMTQSVWDILYLLGILILFIIIFTLLGMEIFANTQAADPRFADSDYRCFELYIEPTCQSRLRAPPESGCVEGGAA